MLAEGRLDDEEGRGRVVCRLSLHLFACCVCVGRAAAAVLFFSFVLLVCTYSAYVDLGTTVRTYERVRRGMYCTNSV